ncbi:MAG: Rieske (2Fe-2S) protein, partial [Alphaproteobacteria bacterium]|nr:Rieske (2Fe-2S) protein [Alphaproteobacteria bacterium]
GRCDVLRCRYHGWVYDGEGRLRRTPDFGPAEDFVRDDFALSPVRTASWRGLVFICLDVAAAPLEDTIADFAELAAAVPLERFVLDSTATHAFACNWKTYIENYLEGYHIPVVHPRLNREIAMAEYRVEVGWRCVRHIAPLREDARGSAVYAGLWAWIAPNAAINVYGSGASIECAWPLGPTTMRLDYLYLFAATDEAGAEQRAATTVMSRAVTAEDQAICEAVQRNLAAGVYERGRLSPRHEAGVHYFQSLIRAALG